LQVPQPDEVQAIKAAVANSPEVPLDSADRSVLYGDTQGFPLYGLVSMHASSRGTCDLPCSVIVGQNVRHYDSTHLCAFKKVIKYRYPYCRFCLELSTVPCLAERLTCWRFRDTFQDDALSLGDLLSARDKAYQAWHGMACMLPQCCTAWTRRLREHKTILWLSLFSRLCKRQ
jgi:hypothetical protein